MRWSVIPSRFDGQIASTGYCVLRPNSAVVMTSFLAHLLGTDSFRKYIEANQVAGNYPSIPDSRIRAYQIPVPPLEVQREIVRILDQFTELEAGLEAELEARRIQYAHYRSAVLAFPESVPRRLLGDVASNLDRLRRPVTRSARQDGMYPYYGANGVQDHVAEYLFDGTFLLMGEDGSVARPNGSPVLNWATGKIWVNNHAHVLVERLAEVRLRFLFHYLQTIDISAIVTGGTQPKLNQANMNKITVPVPTRADQDRIIDILDKFEALTNDLSIGLPAELAARRKQYEYYRDKLLTFEEAAA